MGGLPGNPYEDDTLEYEKLRQAVLALTFEQRTANLIAFYNDENLVRHTDDKVIKRLTTDIRSRLNLTNADEN